MSHNIATTHNKQAFISLYYVSPARLRRGREHTRKHAHTHSHTYGQVKPQTAAAAVRAHFLVCRVVPFWNVSRVCLSVLLAIVSNHNLFSYCPTYGISCGVRLTTCYYESMDKVILVKLDAINVVSKPHRWILFTQPYKLPIPHLRYITHSIQSIYSTMTRDDGVRLSLRQHL